jgi:NAD(P)-dependent dehydrogenase (short-subunit alcohol dehydrogenase family)
MIDLCNKRILVTGASSGIGRAVAYQAAALGASVILIGRDVDRLKEARSSLAGTGHEHYSVDVTDSPAVEQIIQTSVANAGVISGFVHSAGIEKTIPFRVSTPKLFAEVFAVNVFAGFETARILSQKGVVAPSGASFVFLSSVSGKIGDSGKVVYCASKSALLAGVKALALELAAKKIRCNSVLPGCVETEMVKRLFESIPAEAKQKIISKHPLGLGTPEEVASLICFLLSEKARWITGSDYVIDGGYTAQ